MDMNLELLLVGLFALLPGFVSSALRSVFLPDESSTTPAWTVTSVLTSLVLNATALVVYFAFAAPMLDLSKNVKDIGSDLADVSGWNVLMYLGLVYMLALAWGLISGLGRHYSPRNLAFLAKMTPIAPEPDVFHRALGLRFRTKENQAKRKTNDHQVPWLKIDTEKLIVFGRFRTGNTRIYQDKPIEIYLEPAYKIENSSLVPYSEGDGAVFVGLYLRIRPKQVIEVFSARDDWRPDLPKPSK